MDRRTMLQITAGAVIPSGCYAGKELDPVRRLHDKLISHPWVASVVESDRTDIALASVVVNFKRRLNENCSDWWSDIYKGTSLLECLEQALFCIDNSDFTD